MEDDEGGEGKDFIASKGLTSAQAAELLLQWGRNELEEKNKPKVCKLSSLSTSFFVLSDVLFMFSFSVANLFGTAEGAHAYYDLDCCHYRGSYPELA